MSARVKTPRKPSAQGRGDRTRRSETPQTIAEGDEGSEAPSTSGAAGRSQAPISPGQKIRVEEKAELQHLNTRLAAYIDRVRYLVDENNRLTAQVRSKEEVVSREVHVVKTTYEKEMKDCKVQLDTVVKERAALQVEKRSLKAQNQELQEQLQRSERDLLERDRELAAAQNRVNDLSNEATALRAEADKAKAERMKAFEKLREALGDLEARKKDVADLREACNEADMKRVETEAELQSALDKLELNKNVHEKQLKEVRTSKQVEISEVDSRLQKEYETRLEDSIAELREYYEDLLAGGREEADRVYEEKIQSLKSEFDRKLAGVQSNREDMRQLQTRLDVVTRRLREKEEEAKGNDERVRELEMLLENERQRYDVMIGEKNDTIAHMQKQVDDIMKQLQDLMEENVRLDMEIATYRNLLEGEESRLNLTPGPEGSRPRRTRVAKLRTPASASRLESMSSPLSRLWPLSRTPAARGASESDSPLKKRKRTFQTMNAEEEDSMRRSLGADGDLEITEVDPNGEFVRIRNKGQNDITMSGFSLKHKASGTSEEGGDVEVVYKFPRTTLKSGATSTIWSGNTSVTHQAPDNLKMNKQWTVGKEMRTVLVDSSDAEVAWFQLNHDHASRTTAVTSTLRGDEELHHQRGDPQQCSVM